MEQQKLAEKETGEECYIRFGNDDPYRMDDLLKIMCVSQQIVNDLCKENQMPQFMQNAVGMAIAIRLANGKTENSISIFMAKLKEKEEEK